MLSASVFRDLSRFDVQLLQWSIGSIRDGDPSYWSRDELLRGFARDLDVVERSNLTAYCKLDEGCHLPLIWRNLTMEFLKIRFMQRSTTIRTLHI